MKKKITLILMIFVLCFTLSASNWYENKPISEYKITGLINVKESEVLSVLNEFKNEELTDDIINKIDSALYAMPWMDFFLINYEENEEDELVLAFEIYELPMVNEIVFVNNNIKDSTLKAEQNIVSDDFFSPGILKANATLVESYYLLKGYKDASIEPSFNLNSENNLVDIIYTVNEGFVYKINKINFLNINTFTKKQLNKEMETKERSFLKSGNFVQSNLDLDIEAIKTLYRNEGFMDVEITNLEVVEVESSSDKYKMLDINITIEEGRQWQIGTISFEGNNVFNNKEIQDVLVLESGEINSLLDIQYQVQKIATLYYNEGYIQTSVNPLMDKDYDNNAINYNFVITESEQSVLEKIVITGLTKTKPYVIERELELEVGDVFSQDALQQSGQNIMNTSIITSINTGLYQGEDPNGVILEIALEEGNQMEIQFGATFGGTVDGFPVSGFLQWNDKNLFGTGMDFGVNLNISPDTQAFSLSLQDTWVGDLRWLNGVSFAFERSSKKNGLQRGLNSGYDNGEEDSNAYPLGFGSREEWKNSSFSSPSSRFLMDYEMYSINTSYNTGYSWVWHPGSLSLSTDINIGLKHTVFDDHYDPFDELIKKYNEKWQFSNSISLSLAWDGRDYIDNTTNGYLFSSSYTYAGGFLGGLSNYNKLSVTAAGYVSLFDYITKENVKKSLVLSANSQVSFMLDQYWNNNGIKDWYSAKDGTTKYEMLYIDGMNIGRGISVVPELSFMWHNQVELSFPIVSTLLDVEAYVSATGVTSTIEDLNKFANIDWYMSAGVGVKFRIPGFPLGLYFCKTSMVEDGNFRFLPGSIFNTGKEGSGMQLVLAITTSFY